MNSRLSPAVRRGLFSQQIARERRASAPEPKRDDHYEEVTSYKCTKCDELHEWRDDAIECCYDKKKAPVVDLPTDHCPVCAEECCDVEGAAHCCLWHDFAHAARVAMARKVEAGSAWVDVIAEATGAKS